MVIDVSELATSTFKTARTADEICSKLTTRLGWKHRYIAARLAIGRSLSLSDQPPELTNSESEDMATSLRGMQLFGEGAHAAAWLSLITQHSNNSDMPKRILQGLVTRHWCRGADLLDRDWKDGGETLAGFVSRLAELAGFARDQSQLEGTSLVQETPTYPGEVHLPIGEIAKDRKSDKRVTFSLNSAGGSPHMAIMGAAGTGKTRTAVHMLRELRQHCAVPLLAFDFKGDIAEKLAEIYNATSISPPDMSIPLDVLHVAAQSEISIKTAAPRIRDSIASIKVRKPSGLQSGALREAVSAVLRKRSNGSVANLSDVAEALEEEYSSKRA